MLAKEKDPQSDAWFDAYFGWLCNRDMNTISVGGGGGWGGYVIGADQDYVGTTMYNSNVKFYGYSYNAPANTYYSKYTGENASWGEVYYNYVVPNSIISLSGKVAQDLIKVYQREISSSLFGINNWGASLLAGPGGAVDLAYQIANTLNEFNPVAQLWDVIAYAFTGKDRFGNEMSLTQASLKALCVVPIFKAGSISYSFGAYKSSGKWISQMASRGWTGNTIQEALTIGKKYPAINKVNPANNATRFVHPATGQSVVVDDITNEIIHLGGPGFKY